MQINTHIYTHIFSIWLCKPCQPTPIHVQEANTFFLLRMVSATWMPAAQGRKLMPVALMTARASPHRAVTQAGPTPDTGSPLAPGIAISQASSCWHQPDAWAPLNWPILHKCFLSAMSRIIFWTAHWSWWAFCKATPFCQVFWNESGAISAIPSFFLIVCRKL